MTTSARVLARTHARSLTAEELEMVSGGYGWKSGTKRTTYDSQGRPVGDDSDVGVEYDR